MYIRFYISEFKIKIDSIKKLYTELKNVKKPKVEKKVIIYLKSLTAIERETKLYICRQRHYQTGQHQGNFKISGNGCLVKNFLSI